MDCPNLAGCPFPDLKAEHCEDCWKMLYCYEDSVHGYDNCSRFKFKEMHGQKPPNDLLPTSDF
jgi:hypothetical protein